MVQKLGQPDRLKDWASLYASVGDDLADLQACRSSSDNQDPLYYWLRALDVELRGKGVKQLPVLLPKPDPATVQPSSSLALNRHLADCFKDLGAMDLYHRFDEATRPQFRTELPFEPVKDKAEYHLRSMFYPGGLAKSALQAGLLQAMNTPQRWGQGAQAFGERFASSQGTRIIRQNLAFWLDTVFQQEPRYERAPYREVGARLQHALSQTWLCYSDRRTRQFAVWRVASAIGSELISNAWRPRGGGYGDSKASSALMRAGADLGGDTASDMLREFLPRRNKIGRFLRWFI
jgi:hypothetical protein